MAENPNTVKLWVDGKNYAGWKSVRITAGLERLARDFEVSVTDVWPGSPNAYRINPGDFVRVLIGQDVMVSGYVDAMPLEYDARGYTMLIRGRSRTADLVDSSPDNDAQQWTNAKPEAIAKDMAKPFGVTVITETATGEPISDHQIKQGETVHDSLNRIAKARQMLITDNATGDLVFAKPGSGGKATTALVLGENILSGSAGFDYAEVYSDYHVKGQRAGDDEQFGPPVAQGLGKATDAGMKRKRVLVVRQSGQPDTKTLQDRASYEQQIRRAKAGEIRYRVAEWRQKDGSLWKPNTMVSIRDPWMKIEQELLISEIIYLLEEGAGMVTELVVIAPSAFVTEPQTAEDKKDDPGSSEWKILPTPPTPAVPATPVPVWSEMDKPK